MITHVLSNTPLWVYGLLIALLVFGFQQARNRNVNAYLAFFVIMAIFFTKYVLAVMRAFDSDLINSNVFVATLSFAFGSFSGYFCSRAVNLAVKAREA